MTDDDLRCIMLRRNQDSAPEPAAAAGRVIVGTPAALAAAHIVDAKGRTVALFPKHCQPIPVPAGVTKVLVDDLLAEWQAAAGRAAARTT